MSYPLLEITSHSSETARLAEEVEDLRHIHGLSLRLAGANSLSDVLLDVLRTAARMVNAPLGSVQLVADGKLQMIGEVGFGETILSQFPTVTLEDCTTCGVALKRRTRVAVNDLRTDHDFTEIAAALYSYGAKGAVSTPILDQAGNVLAMFSLYWRESHQPDERELRVLDLCAELAGRHVERSVTAKALRDHDQRQTLLMRELAHRGKNLLSVIQAIAGRSLRGVRTLDEAREVFIGRLGALSNTYNTLTDESPENVQLHDIAAAGLNHHSNRISINGPALEIPAKHAQTLALVIHELVTNAAKYGALTVTSGRIDVSWQVIKAENQEDQFSFFWREIDGPPAKTPSRLGFGSTIVTKVVGSELKCEPTVAYRESGFEYQLDCSLGDLMDGSLRP